MVGGLGFTSFFTKYR